MKNKQIIRYKLYAKYILSKANDDYKKYDNKKQNIVVALAADYGNLGDVAITYAQSKFLNKKFPEANIIDFPISKTFVDMKSLKKVIKKGDIISIVGGGNTGDMYDDIEYCRQFVISQFPKNKIISFPQTIDFSNSEFGKKALDKSIKSYSKHKDLTLSAREIKSYDIYDKYFKKNKVVLVPDIVLSLDESDLKVKRKGITLVLRSDSEKRIDANSEQMIRSAFNKDYTISYEDTHIEESQMSVLKRSQELEKKWRVFKESKLIITDRLHGMIFSAITKTPCIAIDNSNRKVSGVHKTWLEELTVIRVMKDFDITELLDHAQDLLKINPEDLKYTDYSYLFEELF